MCLPVEQIANALVIFATDCQGMASAVFSIKKRKQIDVHLEQILVQMNIVGRDWVREIVKIVALKNFFCKESLESNYHFYLKDYLIRDSTEALSRYSARPRFKC